LAIPGARGLFSHIQAALRSADTTKRIRASQMFMLPWKTSVG
jgi:hypothetical protein